MGDGEITLPALHMNLDGTHTRRELDQRAARLALPAVALSEWAELHGVPLGTAKGLAQRGEFPPGAVWRSGRDWLIRPTEPRPATRPGPQRRQE